MSKESDKKLYKLRRDNGQCVKCAGPSQKKLCDGCNLRLRKNPRNRRINSGICTRCNNIAVEGYVVCSEHLRIERQLRQHRLDEVKNDYEKLQNRRKQGMDRYNFYISEGRCSNCGGPDKLDNNSRCNKCILSKKRYDGQNHVKEAKSIYYNNKRKTDLNYKISKNIRTRFRKAIIRKSKKGSAVKLLGCSVEEFILYISDKFKEGMDWNNYGEWHLDHIIPLSSFNLEDEKQLAKACHYTNLQPLWALENLRKSNKNGV